MQNTEGFVICIQMQRIVEYIVDKDPISLSIYLSFPFISFYTNSYSMRTSLKNLLNIPTLGLRKPAPVQMRSRGLPQGDRYSCPVLFVQRQCPREAQRDFRMSSESEVLRIVLSGTLFLLPGFLFPSDEKHAEWDVDVDVHLGPRFRRSPPSRPRRHLLPPPRAISISRNLCSSSFELPLPTMDSCTLRTTAVST